VCVGLFRLVDSHGLGISRQPLYNFLSIVSRDAATQNHPRKALRGKTSCTRASIEVEDTPFPLVFPMNRLRKHPCSRFPQLLVHHDFSQVEMGILLAVNNPLRIRKETVVNVGTKLDADTPVVVCIVGPH